MDEKSKKKLKDTKKKKRRYRSSSDSSSGSEEWVEKTVDKQPAVPQSRDDWMSMSGMLKTYSKDDIRPKREEKDKKHIDSYNPATNSRELNPYWKHGGTGVPQTSEEYRKSNKFMKPNDDDYYSKSSYYSADSKHSKSSNYSRDKEYSKNKEHSKDTNETYRKSYNWRRNNDEFNSNTTKHESSTHKEYESNSNKQLEKQKESTNISKSLYLSDEKMNKLAAKIVKAEILGDEKTVKELKAKLEAAKEYRKQNPDIEKIGKVEREAVLLINTTPSGSSRPVVVYSDKIRDKGKVKTHNSGGRVNYFPNDEKYDISTMFEQEKYGTNHRNDVQLATAASKCKDPENLEDIFEQGISENRHAAKESKSEESYVVKQNIKLERSQENCTYCFESKNMLKHLMISCSNKVYLSLPSRKSLVEGHCIITTIHHYPCVTSVDEDVWEEIMTYRNMITQFFNQQGKDVVFFETATKLYRHPHLAINCVPLPRDVGDMASIYFKKALLECETEWSMNKKVIELKGKNVRKGVPKGLPYFWVDFGMDPGFAHVIEDQNDFPETFAQQIIGGMLDLDHRLWKKPQGEYGEAQRKKVVEFLKEWKPFEESFKRDTKR